VTRTTIGDAALARPLATPAPETTPAFDNLFSLGGLKKPGLDPTQIRTLPIRHGHGDHGPGQRGRATPAWSAPPPSNVPYGG